MALFFVLSGNRFNFIYGEELFNAGRSAKFGGLFQFSWKIPYDFKILLALSEKVRFWPIWKVLRWMIYKDNF